MKTIRSNGKLLLTAEYLVLDEAVSLAVPTKKGQSLDIENGNDAMIQWQSLDWKGNCWYNESFKIVEQQVIPVTNTDKEVSKTLAALLNECKRMNPNFLNNDSEGFQITTRLEFPRDWGLGSSSTLINNLAQWAKVDAFKLLWNAFSGSGYDIACAQNDTPITYQLQNGEPLISTIDFDPPFAKQLFFVHLNQKQNSREGIAHYRNFKGNLAPVIKAINDITAKFASCELIDDFENLLTEHELLISNIIELNPVKQQLFPDYFGSIKSLGAWGGDFILATGNSDTRNYFKKKGFETVIPYTEMIL